MKRLWLVLLAGCGLSAEDTDTAAVYCDTRDPVLTWDNFGEGFMNQHCTGCHGVQLPESSRVEAPVSVNFDTYADTLQWYDRVVDRTLVTGGMPPGGGPTEEELARLEEWLSCQVAHDLVLWEAM